MKALGNGCFVFIVNKPTHLSSLLYYSAYKMVYLLKRWKLCSPIILQRQFFMQPGAVRVPSAQLHAEHRGMKASDNGV